MLNKLISIIVFFVFASLVYSQNIEPLVINAIISSTDITFKPAFIEGHTPFIIHVINKSGVPVELENSDTSVEVYAGMDKTFKIGLSAGKYKFFNDFNPKTKIADLTILTAAQIKAQQTQPPTNLSDSVPSNTLNNPQINNNHNSTAAEITFIMWRESIEALLVVGIVYSWLKQLKTGRRVGMLFLALGIGVGTLCAILLGYILIQLNSILVGNVQEYLQAGLTTIAALMIIYMIKWMRTNGSRLKSDMYNTLSIKENKRWNISILLVVAIAIAREGSEAVIFIYALGFGQHGIITSSMFSAVIAGLLLAILTIYLLSLGNKIFSWRYFFKITEIMLLLLGGALLLNAVDLLTSSGILPVLKAKFWDTSFILSDGGHFVPLLASVIGYRATPSLMDILVYIGYWLGVLWFIKPKYLQLVKE